MKSESFLHRISSPRGRGTHHPRPASHGGRRHGRASALSFTHVPPGWPGLRGEASTTRTPASLLISPRGPGDGPAARTRLMPAPFFSPQLLDAVRPGEGIRTGRAAFPLLHTGGRRSAPRRSARRRTNRPPFFFDISLLSPAPGVTRRRRLCAESIFKPYESRGGCGRWRAGRRRPTASLKSTTRGPAGGWRVRASARKVAGRPRLFSRVW